MPDYERGEPRPVHIPICSLCKLPWKDHMQLVSDLSDGEIEVVTAQVCVYLLRHRNL